MVELRIRADMEQIRRMIPIIDKMLKAGFLPEYGDWSFIAPFQYGNDRSEVAIIRYLQSGNIIMESFSPIAPAQPDAKPVDDCTTCRKNGHCGIAPPSDAEICQEWKGGA